MFDYFSYFPVVGINNGCSKLPCFLGGDKEYYTKCVFGRGTDTYNQEGKTTMTKSFSEFSLVNYFCSIDI